MSAAPNTAERIYARPPHFTVHYRAGRRLRWSAGPRTDYAALLLLEGQLRWQSLNDETEEFGVAGASGLISEGSVLLGAPGDVLSAAANGGTEFLLITLAPLFVHDCAVRARLARSDSVVSFRAHAVERDERLARLARDLAEELLNESAGQELVVGALVEHALVQLLRRYSNVRRSENLELSRAGLVDRRIRLAVELMHAHLDRDLPLEEIAEAAHLSPFHFARLFKKLSGATPHAYLASLRAARARELLAGTDLSVTEVGARVGYMSSSHFAKAFRQASGLSPRAYRRALVRG
ncbi:MAG TPA: helix-turn-helix domain-containing protein [Pyrinomonadaceae bacterium]|jgi:AraC family transcriptional regulator|nr:helix-turn-helix domain-containing protein [Pyrinomonadaceae bacterium]